jgi:hypothetical protein
VGLCFYNETTRHRTGDQIPTLSQTVPAVWGIRLELANHLPMSSFHKSGRVRMKSRMS